MTEHSRLITRLVCTVTTCTDPISENNKVLTVSDDGYSWKTVSQNVNESQNGNGDISINAVGQSFYDIITEQPRPFDISLIDDASFAKTFSTIDIAWNFDNLIPFNTYKQHLNITGDLNQRVLPCITHIYFDISSSDHVNVVDSSDFVIAVDSNHNYNVDVKQTVDSLEISDANLTFTLTYKTLKLKKANTKALKNQYTVRVWGKNQSNETDVYKLTYRDLAFISSGIPSVPQINEFQSSISSNIATLSFGLNVPDIDVDNSDTILNISDEIYIYKVEISGTEIETLRSSFYSNNSNKNFEIESSSLDTNDQNQPDTSVEDISVNVFFTDTSFNLGSKYKIQAKCVNILNDTGGSNNDGYTSYSTVFQMTDFIDIPISSGANTDDPFGGNPTVTEPYGGSGTTQSIKLSSTSRDVSLYLLQDLNENAQITPSRNSDDSIVEITHPNETKEHTTGYGKFIDNSENIISINCSLYKNGSLDASLQQVDYHGWNSQTLRFTSNLKDTNITPFTNLGAQDQESNTHAQGFRLQAVYLTDTDSLKIKDLSDNDIISPFDPSFVNSGYQIEYNLVRSDDYDNDSNNFTKISGDFYVDSFPNYDNPNYITDSSNITVTGITWVMGIPQVSTVDISFTRNHININSEYKYFQSNGLVAEVNSIQANDDDDVYSNNKIYLDGLTYSELNTDGSYNGSFSGTRYYNYIDSSQDNNTVSSLDVNSTIYNLYTSQDYTETFSVMHYRDVTSISNYSTIFDNNIYEIIDISEIGSDISNVHNNSLQLYQDASSSTEIKDHSILYIDGLFQLDSRTSTSNQYYSYPDICNSFEWNGLISSYSNNTYINKDNRYTTSGAQDESNGYRWLVYKVDEGDNSVEFVDAGSNSKGTAGINLSYIMNKLFGSTIETEFYESLTDSSYNDDILVYIVGTNKSSGIHFLGRIIQDSPGFDTNNKWYTANNIISGTSLQNMASGEACGALPGSSLQKSIRENIASSHPSRTNFNSNINGHSPHGLLYR